MKISFVIPVCNERETLAPLVEAIAEHAAPHEYRIYVVNDGSTDGTRETLDELADQYDTVEAIHFNRNRGKSAALAAGFALAHGDVVFTLDGDLQDDPKEIPRFIAKLDEGYDMVCGWKAVRHDPWHKVLASRLYNRTVARLFGLSLHDVNCGFKAMRAEVARDLRVYGELHRLIPVLAFRQGYTVGEIDVEHHPRRHGKSKYGLERLTRGALDVYTLWFLDRYGDRPSHFFGRWGILAIVLGAGVFAAGLAAGISRGSTPSILLGALLGAALAGIGVLSFGLGLVAELVVWRLPARKD